MKVEAYKVFSFTTLKNQGNPAGVMLDAEGLSEDQMMKISQILSVSETAFLFPSDDADFSIRFFSPSCEVDLCGHATIAAFTLIGQNTKSKSSDTISFTQQTRVGKLRVNCFYQDDELDRVMMQQQPPIIQNIDYNETLLADALQIEKHHICFDLPSCKVSTGLFTLPVCIDCFAVLQSMRPDFPKVKFLCESLNVGSMHVYSFDTLEDTSLYHARNFAPVYGINEDPVTGTANGAVCSYLQKFHQLSSSQVICEQGDIINHAGRVFVDLSKESVWVGGKAIVDSPQFIDI